MTAFGIMSLSLESEASYITEIAKHGESLGVECFRFIPSEINPYTLQVKGKRFDHRSQAWFDAEFPIPNLLYDRCFYGDDEHSKQCLPIVSWLKSKEDITFLGYGLPNKLELYDALKDTVLSAYLPPTQSVPGPGVVLKELHAGKRIILKPVNGSQGYGIYYLRKSDKTIHVKTEKQQKIISRIFPNEAKLTQWLQSLFRKHQYLMQPYLELSNQDSQPFDIRILMQKNDKGIWGVRGRGIRVGTTGGILSNLSAGGSVKTYAEWAAAIPPAKGEYIKHELQYILRELPQLLEKRFLPLFEIGVDIGIAKNGSIWILDINSKPGRKVLLQTRPNLKDILFRAPLLYAKLLSQTDSKERKYDHAKTLSH
ncbi:YheC/YheD family protein [Neobacillus niacini]|uniref:YheC/YheD family endospore coat-associated protein n=1 Tax=Neobacillus niacini TaxID=86668 RepID=UPI0021CAEA64|nr:YheC/YheD family protein [Neobacillus niacini]MCM3767348.1 YheC/YheD family protein [Neobacillus niacini]